MKTKLLLFAIIFTQTAIANYTKIINIFYSYKLNSLALNIQNQDNSTSFIRTNRILLTSQNFAECHELCNVSLEAINNNSFHIILNGQTIAKVSVNDRYNDGLLPARSFELVNSNGKTQLLLDIDQLQTISTDQLAPTVEWLK